MPAAQLDPANPHQPNGGDTQRARRSPTRVTRQSRLWRTIFFLLAMVLLVPGLIQFARAEIGRWKLAMCYEAQLNNNDELAERHLNEALRWNPFDQRAQNYQTSFVISRGRASDALAAAESSLEDARIDYDTTPSLNNRSRLAAALNLSAYVSGLCDLNLETALERINEAFELHGDATNSAMLGTRGYVLWRMGRNEEALKDMNLAIEEYKHDYLIARRVVQQNGTYVVDERTVSRALQAVDEQLAALYYHRGLANQSLGRDDQVTRDFQRVTNLGCDPQNGVY